MGRKEKTVLLGTVINIFLATFKLLAGFFSGSVGLIADGIHSSTDIVASVALFLGVRLSKRKSKMFPYGMYKIENLISLFISFVIFFAGYEILREVLFNKKSYELKNIWVGIIVEGIAILATYLFSRYEYYVGSQEESPGLIADSQHMRSDMFASSIIVVGLVGALFNFRYLDKVSAVIVAIFIFKAGYEVAIDAVRVLLDASIDYNTLDRVKEIIRKSPFVKDVKAINGRNSGSYKFLEAVVTLKIKDLNKAHRIVSEIEKEIKKEIPHVDSVIIHYEPAKRSEDIIAIPIDNPRHISNEFGSAPFFLLVHKKNGKIVKEEILKNPNQDLERGKGIKTAEWLAKQGVDKIFLRREIQSPGPKYVFEDYEIEVSITDKSDPEEIVSEIEI